MITNSGTDTFSSATNCEQFGCDDRRLQRLFGAATETTKRPCFASLGKTNLEKFAAGKLSGSEILLLQRSFEMSQVRGYSFWDATTNVFPLEYLQREGR